MRVDAEIEWNSLTSDSLTMPDTTLVEQALARVLDSTLFSQAQRQSRLLRYIVEESLSGRGGRLSQFSIAIDVFDRGADFDPTTDSAVRVEVGRLRAKLREYYEQFPDEAVVLRLPKGRYVADIVVTEHAPPVASIAPPSSRITPPTLVVLPFNNLGGDSQDEYFADGISEDLITDLSKLSGLRVIARNSAFAYKGKQPSPQQLRSELKTTHLLEGSVRRAGKRVRINAQLVECSSGDNIWAERFDRDLVDIFALQDEVGQRIVGALSLALTATDRFRFADRGTDNLKAYDYSLRAARLGWSREEISEAVRLLERAVELDPEYARALARIALMRWYQAYCGWIEMNEVGAIVTLAQRAVDLDPNDSSVQSIHGFVNFWYGTVAIADRATALSVTLDPTNVAALERRAICLVYLGRVDAAAECIERAKSLNPHEPYYFPRGLIAFMRDDFPLTLELLSASAERFPKFMPTRVFLVSLHRLMGNDDDARAQIETILEISPNISGDALLRRWGNFSSLAAERFTEGFRRAWQDLGESTGN